MPDVSIESAAVEFVGRAIGIGENEIIARLADAAGDGGLIGGRSTRRSGG